MRAHATKLFRLPDGRLFGGSGNYFEVLAVYAWLSTGGDKPALTEFAGLVVDATGHCLRFHESLVSMPIHEPFHAIGSGRDFALAAMALGKTAAEAVALAMRFDVLTGGQIDVLTLEVERVPLTEVLIPGAHVATADGKRSVLKPTCREDELVWSPHGPR